MIIERWCVEKTLDANMWLNETTDVFTDIKHHHSERGD